MVGIAFRLRSELGGVSFDTNEIASVEAQPLSDFNNDGTVDCDDIDAYVEARTLTFAGAGRWILLT